MTKILEIKDALIRFTEEYEAYVKILGKFLVALSLFLLISMNIGYNTRLSSLPVVVVLALVCSLLPQFVTVIFSMILVCANMYSLCMEAALISALLLLLLLLIYFRFTPKGTTTMLLTPVAFKLGIPYAMPVNTGLLGEAYNSFAVGCGVVLYYFFAGIHQNASILVDPNRGDEQLSNLDIVLGQLTGNREMFLVVMVMVIATLITYMIRRMQMDNAWTIAIASGLAFQIVGLVSGYLFLKLSDRILPLIIGSVVSGVVCFIIKFFFMNLDYARIERTQFEDDDYYYYVKAIPKKNVSGEEITVKYYGNTGSIGKRMDRKKSSAEVDEEISKKVFAREMDIDEDLLK